MLSQYADFSQIDDNSACSILSDVPVGFGSVSYSYNRRLQPVKESWSAGGLSWVKSYAFDSLDRVYATQFPDGGVLHVYFNDQGLLRQIPGIVGEFTYDAFGRVTQKNYANNLQTMLDYHPDDFRLKQIKTGSLQDLSYAYDDVGNVLSISSAAGESYTQTYAYDGLDRLTQATESPAGFRLSYKYDAVGNLLEINSSGQVSTYTYGTGNSPGPHAVMQIQGGGQSVDCSGNLPPAVGDWIVSSPTLCRLSTIILSLGSKLRVTGGQSVTLQDSTLNLDGDVELDGNLVLDGPQAGVSFGGNSGVGTQGASPAGTQTLTYDGSGSLTSGFSFTYEYDDANRLKKVSKGGSIVEEYVYDYNGRRFKKTSGGETTYYIGKNYETKVNSSGTFNTVYYYANGELVGRKDPDGSTKYYHNDHLGGTHLVTNSSGGEAERTRYQPFGGIIEGGQSRNLFTGQEWDKNTGQYYYGARYYNPTLQRFTQADTILQNVYDPQLLNRYTYTRNNPVKYTDPSGHVIPALLVGAAVVGGGGGAVYYHITHTAEERTMRGYLSYTFGGAFGAVIALGAPELMVTTVGEGWAAFLAGGTGASVAQVAENYGDEIPLTEDVPESFALGGTLTYGVSKIAKPLNPRNLKTVPGVFTTKTGAEHLSSYAAENTMQSGLEYYTLDQDDEYSTKSYGTSSSGHATYYYGTVPETKTCCCQTPTTNQGQSRREDYIDLTNWGHQSR